MATVAQSEQRTPQRNQPVRFLLLDSGRGLGGSAKFAYYLLKNLNREYFVPSLAFYGFHETEEIERIRQLGVPVWFFPPSQLPSLPTILLGSFRSKLVEKVRSYLEEVWRWTFSYAPSTWSLLKFLRRAKPDLVLLNSDVHYHIPGMLASHIAGIPIICRKAGGIGERPILRRFLGNWVDTFITVSDATDRDQRQTCDRHIVLVNEGIDTDEIHPVPAQQSLRTRLGIPPSCKVVASAARFREGKGQLLLVHAAAKVVVKYPNVRFVMYGAESPEHEQFARTVIAEATKLGIAEKIILPGWIETTSDTLSIVDVFVHCPTIEWIEAVGIANLEAMGAAKPTVVSENGGLPEVVEDGVTGFVVPLGDVDATSDAILKLLIDDDLSSRMGGAGRARVLQRYDIAKNNRELEEILRAASGRPRHKTANTAAQRVVPWWTARYVTGPFTLAALMLATLIIFEGVHLAEHAWRHFHYSHKLDVFPLLNVETQNQRARATASDRQRNVDLGVQRPAHPVTHAVNATPSHLQSITNGKPQ